MILIKFLTDHPSVDTTREPSPSTASINLMSKNTTDMPNRETTNDTSMHLVSAENKSDSDTRSSNRHDHLKLASQPSHQTSPQYDQPTFPINATPSNPTAEVYFGKLVVHRQKGMMSRKSSIFCYDNTKLREKTN
jgi:hypothetical protein